MDNKQYVEQMLTEGEKLAQTDWKWLVKGIDNSYNRATMAILAENQSKVGGERVGRTMGTSLNEGLVNEATLSTNIYGVNQILLPVIRRVYPFLMANNWVSIQPMLSPVSLIFYLRYFASGSKSGTTAGDEYLQVPLTGEFGFDPYYSSDKNVLNDTVPATLTTAVNSGAKGFTNFTPLNASVFVRAYQSGAILSEVQFQGVYGTATALPAVPVRGSSALAGMTYNSVTESLSTVSTVAGADKYEVEWTYDQETAGDFGSGNGIPELDIRIQTDPVQARERKLKTQWTLEAHEDLKVLHNVDTEKELVNLMASHILGEIDREIIKELMDGAAHRANHDFTDDTNNNTTGNVIDRNQSLAMKIAYLSAQIHKSTRVAGANFLVTSPLIAARLEEVRGYVPLQAGDNVTAEYGIQLAGALPGGRIRVYKDPLFPEGRILLGYKGKTFLDSGYFYCPYVPIKTTPVVYDPDTLQPRRGMLTRYATKMIDGGEYFFGVISVRNLAGS